MIINDKAFDPSTAYQILDFPLATSQTQFDSQRASIDPEYKAYRNTPAFWLDRGFEGSAYQDKTGANTSIEFHKYFTTRDEAQAFADQFAKGSKVVVSTLTGGHGSNAERWELFSVTATYRLISNGVTGDKNETGIKRVQGFVKRVEKLELAVNWVYSYTNSITWEQTQAAFA